MKKYLMLVICLLLSGCIQNDSASKKQLKEDRAPFLAGLELTDQLHLKNIQAIEVTPTKPTRKIKSSAEVIFIGPTRTLTTTEKAIFQEIFSSKENFNSKIKKKCIFIAEFMISFDDHKDFFLFVSLSTNQVKILNKNSCQIVDFSNSFENSEQIHQLKYLLTKNS